MVLVEVEQLQARRHLEQHYYLKHLVYKETQVPKVILVHRVIQVLKGEQVVKDTQVPKVILVHRVIQVLKDTPDLKVIQDHKGIQVSQAPKVLQVLKETLVLHQLLELQE